MQILCQVCNWDAHIFVQRFLCCCLRLCSFVNIGGFINRKLGSWSVKRDLLHWRWDSSSRFPSSSCVCGLTSLSFWFWGLWWLIFTLLNPRTFGLLGWLWSWLRLRLALVKKHWLGYSRQSSSPTCFTLLAELSQVLILFKSLDRLAHIKLVSNFFDIKVRVLCTKIVLIWIKNIINALL